jgi:hypothetical protein
MNIHDFLADQKNAGQDFGWGWVWSRWSPLNGFHSLTHTFIMTQDQIHGRIIRLLVTCYLLMTVFSATDFNHRLCCCGSTPQIEPRACVFAPIWSASEATVLVSLSDLSLQLCSTFFRARKVWVAHVASDSVGGNGQSMWSVPWKGKYVIL